jgi:hypothetical protein
VEGLPGFTDQGTVGYLHVNSDVGLVGLSRHFNSSTGDYLLTTSTSPPSGYSFQATLGFVHTSGAPAGGGVAYQNLTYGFDNAGNVTAITDTVGFGSRTFIYDDLNRLTRAIENFGPNLSLVTHDYSYDSVGNILTKAGVSYCYGYMTSCSDSAHPLALKSTSDGNTYTYDNNGNTLSGGDALIPGMLKTEPAISRARR